MLYTVYKPLDLKSGRSTKTTGKIGRTREMCKKKESPAKLIRLGTYAVETIFIKETAPKTFSLLIVISYSPDKVDLKDL